VVDPRHQKLAKVLVNYSTKVKPGEKVLIRAGAIAAPLVLEVVREAMRAGAHTTTRIGLEGLPEIFFAEANDEQLAHVSQLDFFQLEYFDVDISIQAEENTKNLSNVDPQKFAKRMSAFAPYSKARLERYFQAKKTRWVGTLFPTQAYAQDAHMSLREYENFVFAGGLLDRDDPVGEWRKVHDEQQRIVDYLNQRDEIHIVAPDTDITYQVRGRNWLNADGAVNFPDGEVFTGPIEESVNGTIHFTYPAIYNGKEVEDVRLTFRDGKVVEASAMRGLDLLNTMLDIDAGARRLGEVAFGLNYNIKQFTGNTLFDEKIGGTMHMALGASIPLTGGVNDSSIHWDIVCDLREGKVFADGQLCYDSGRFIV